MEGHHEVSEHSGRYGRNIKEGMTSVIVSTGNRYSWIFGYSHSNCDVLSSFSTKLFWFTTLLLIGLHLSVHMKPETRLQLVTAFPISVGL